MSNKEVMVGDKFVIEIEHAYWSPSIGNRYFVKGCPTLVFDDDGIKRLEPYKEPPKEVPHSCQFCKYQDRRIDEMPCVICDKNDVQPRDMFEWNGK